MPIRLNDTDNIYEWETGELWNALNLLDSEEVKEFEEELRKIKYGYEILVPIHYIIENWYEDAPFNKTTTVQGYGKFDILEFRDELDKRKSEMRKIIIMNIEDEGYTERS